MEEENLDNKKNNNKSNSAMRTIGEVSDLVDVPQHVLRFWEGKFKQINPRKSRGRRYYRVDDINIILKIKRLLYEEGYTIKGVQQNLSNNLKNSQLTLTDNSKQGPKPVNMNEELNKVLDVLKKSRDQILSII